MKLQNFRLDTIEQGPSVYNLHLATTAADPAATGILIDADDVNCTAADSSDTAVNCVERVAITNGDGSLKTAATTSFQGQITPLFTITGTPTAKPSNTGERLCPSIAFGYMVALIFGMYLWAT